MENKIVNVEGFDLTGDELKDLKSCLEGCVMHSPFSLVVNMIQGRDPFDYGDVGEQQTYKC